MAREIGNLYYTIGIKGEKEAIDSLKRVEQAKSKASSSHDTSGLKSLGQNMASGIREGLIDSVWERIRSGKSASSLKISGIFEQAVDKGVKAGIVKSRRDVSSLYGVVSASEAANALNSLARQKRKIPGGSNASQVKDLATRLRDVRVANGSEQQLLEKKAELQARRTQLRSEAQSIESRRAGTAASRSAAAAPLHAESMRLLSIIKKIDERLHPGNKGALADSIASQRAADANKRQSERQSRYSSYSGAIGSHGPDEPRISVGSMTKAEVSKLEKSLKLNVKKAHRRWATELISGVTDLPLNRWLKTQEEDDARGERELLRQDRLAARRAGNKGAIGNRVQHAFGLPVGSIGGSQSVFGAGRKPVVNTPMPPLPPEPTEMLGPSLSQPLPMPWLYRISGIMTRGGHRRLSDHAGAASALANEIIGQSLNYGINTELRDARREVRAAQGDQRVASRAGDPVAMEAANRRLNTAQNALLDMEERRLFVAGQHRDIIRDVNTFLGTTVTLESKIAAAEGSAVSYARQRMQNMTPEQEAGVRERARQSLLSRVAHGGTKAAQYEQDRDELRAKRRETGQYVMSAAGAGDVVAREYYNNLKSAEAIRRRQAENEHRMAEIRQQHGGSAPVMFQGDRREYRTLEREQKQLEIRMMKHNDVLKGVSSANNRWNTQIMELGYGIQDFTQVLAGGGGLSAALRGASNNFSQFFAVSGGRNAALWATGIGVGALAVGAALDAISNQSKEAAENLRELRKVANDLSAINLGSLSRIGTIGLNATSTDIFSNQDSGVSKIKSARETAITARKEMDLYRRTRSGFTDVAEYMSDLWTGGSYGVSLLGRGREFVDKERKKGRLALTGQVRDAGQIFMSRLAGEQHANGKSYLGEAVSGGGLLSGAQALINSGSTLGEQFYDAAKNKLEGESQKRISDIAFSESMKNYKTQTGTQSSMSARSQVMAFDDLVAKRNELDKRNNILRDEKRNNELTPEAKAEYAQEIRRNQARIDALNQRIKIIQSANVNTISSVNGQSQSGVSMEAALDEYVQAKTKSKLAVVSGDHVSAASMEANLRQTASSYSTSQMTGESISDFQDRVATEIKHQQEIIASAAKESGKNLDYLSDRIKMLGDLAVDVAKAMESYDRSIAGTSGLLERDAEYERDMAAIEQEKQNRYAENKKKYELTDPVLQMELDAVAHDDANRKIKRREFQMIKDQNDEKMFFGNKIASMVGGREGRKLQAEMEYDQMLASIEQGKMDPAMKAEKQQEAKDIRSAMMEDIDRKNVSFTDVGSQWKTIQSSLQGEPNKKILNHWNKYMGLVTGEGIRVKLSVGT